MKKILLTTLSLLSLNTLADSAFEPVYPGAISHALCIAKNKPTKPEAAEIAASNCNKKLKCEYMCKGAGLYYQLYCKTLC